MIMSVEKMSLQKKFTIDTEEDHFSYTCFGQSNFQSVKDECLEGLWNPEEIWKSKFLEQIIFFCSIGVFCNWKVRTNFLLPEIRMKEVKVVAFTFFFQKAGQLVPHSSTFQIVDCLVGQNKFCTSPTHGLVDSNFWPCSSNILYHQLFASQY